MDVQKQDTFYTVAEVSKMLRLSKMTIYRMIQNADFDYVQIGKSYRISAPDLHKKYPELNGE